MSSSRGLLVLAALVLLTCSADPAPSQPAEGSPSPPTTPDETLDKVKQAAQGDATRGPRRTDDDDEGTGRDEQQGAGTGRDEQQGAGTGGDEQQGAGTGGDDDDDDDDEAPTTPNNTTYKQMRLSDEGLSLWLSWSQTCPQGSRFFSAVRDLFAKEELGGSIRATPDQMNNMSQRCDVAAESAMLDRVLAHQGTKVLVAHPLDNACNAAGGDSTALDELQAKWQQATTDESVYVLLFTLANDATEYPDSITKAERSRWSMVAPDNFFGGSLMGKSACMASLPPLERKFVFILDSANSPWCNLVLDGFKIGLNYSLTPDCTADLISVVIANDDTENAGYAQMRRAFVKNPNVRGVASCVDALAMGASRFWTDYNAGAQAAGMFVASFGATPKYREAISKGEIDISIDPMIDSAAGAVRAMKVAAWSFISGDNFQLKTNTKSPVWPRGKYLRALMQAIVLQGGYFTDVRPNFGGTADIFDISIDYSSVSRVNFAENTFEAAGWIKMVWNDSRAVFDQHVFALYPTELMPWAVADIYRPELVWPNLIEDKLSQAVEKLESDGEGSFIYETEFRGIFSCSMSIDSFPFDVQACQVQIMTRQALSEVVLLASTVGCGPAQAGEYCIKYSNNSEALTYSTPAPPNSQAVFNIYFKRDFTTFMLAVVMPCMMLSVIGYSSFFLTSQPARAAFSIICFLSNLNVQSLGWAMTPKHTGIAWCDFFLLAHAILAFLVLLENVLSFVPALQFPKREGPKGEPSTLPKVPDTNVMINPLGHSRGDFSRGDEKSDPGPGTGVGAGAQNNGGMDLDHAIAMENIGVVPNSIESSPEEPEDEPWWVYWSDPRYTYLCSGNYCDMVAQRAFPIVYIAVMAVMCISLFSIEEDFPSAAMSVQQACAQAQNYGVADMDGQMERLDL